MSASFILLEEGLDPVEPIDLSWDNLTCSIKTKEGKKQILKEISGHALHNEFLVIMGSSGAGKTTLLNILSDRLRGSKKTEITGEILANNSPISSIGYKKYIGYVTQEDTLVDTMTVYECLMFVANLKTNYVDKEDKVNLILEELKLLGCKHTKIGGPYIKGISGGEKKRTSIGMELITNPSVLFLDEPTSGLDSYTAMLVLKVLTYLAKTGKTVISTIHQPSSDMFYSFDKLMLMGDGQVIFHGLAKDSVHFFGNAGFECPHLSNPSDYFMEVLYINNANALTNDEKQVIDTLHSQYDKTRIRAKCISVPLDSGTKSYKTSFLYQIYILTMRSYLRIVRNPILSIMRLVLTIVVAVLVDIFYWDVGSSGDNAISNRSGLLFFIVCWTVFANVLACVLTFPSMRQIMIKEHNSHMYGVIPYFISLNITDVFFDVASSLAYVTIIYWAVGLNTNTSSNVAVFYFITYAAFLAGGSLGMMCGALVDRAELALAATSALLFPFMYFAGFFRSKNLPDSSKWMENISPFYYIFQAYMKNQFDDLDITNCSKEECHPLVSFDVNMSIARSVLTLLAICAMFRGLGLLGMFHAVKQKTA